MTAKFQDAEGSPDLYAVEPEEQSTKKRKASKSATDKAAPAIQCSKKAAPKPTQASQVLQLSLKEKQAQRQAEEVKKMAAKAAALQASAAKAQKAAQAAAAKLASDKGAANEAAEAKAIAQEHRMAAGATAASATLATGKGAVTHIVGSNAGKPGCGKDRARRALQQLANSKKASSTSAGNEPFRHVRGVIKDDDEDDDWAMQRQYHPFFRGITLRYRDGPLIRECARGEANKVMAAAAQAARATAPPPPRQQ
ncbi:TPA: hypothetical protein ACH3X1_009087 [Trebouxia sp. C0004]